MYRIPDLDCTKCGGTTSVTWIEPEKSSGMDIKPLKSGGMERTCHRCGFSKFIDTLDDKVDANN